MSKRQSVSSGLSVSTLNEPPPLTFEQYLSMVQDQTMTPNTQETTTSATSTTATSEKPTPGSKKSQQPSSKYGIHVQRGKGKNNFIELNKQKVEKARQDQVQTPQGSHSSWRNLIEGVLDLQRGKIPLLLAVEAGNQSMCRELLSAQTTEQLTVSLMPAATLCAVEKSIIKIIVFIYRLIGNNGKWRYSTSFGDEAS